MVDNIITTENVKTINNLANSMAQILSEAFPTVWLSILKNEDTHDCSWVGFKQSFHTTHHSQVMEWILYVDFQREGSRVC